MQASAFAEEADQAASLVAIGGTVVGVGLLSYLARSWWDPVTDAFVAVPAFYVVAVLGAALAGLLLTVRARITDNDRLRWIVSGLAIAGTAIAFQGTVVTELSRVPELASPSGAASLYWIWHGALAVFAIGGAIAPHRQGLRRGLLSGFAGLLVLVLFEPAWDMLPPLVAVDGRFAAAYRPVTAALVALSLVAVVVWVAVHGRSATRPDVWVAIMLMLATLGLLRLYQADGWGESIWWSSPELRTAPFVALACGLLADAVRLFGLLHRHERSLREQLNREVDFALHGPDQQTREPDARPRIEATLRDETFFAVFQPIVSLGTGKLLAVEALTRFTGQPARTPDRWFDEAHTVGLGIELELAALRTALAAAEALPRSVAISMNASPVTLSDPRLLSLLDAWPDRRPLIIELTEHAAIDDYSTLDAVLVELRERGIRIAIDDAGAGFASLRHVVRLNPDLIKLDMSLTRDVDRDPVRRALAASLADFARRTDTALIAEGVERPGELATLDELGVTAAQGYLLGRPVPIDELSVDLLDGTGSALPGGRGMARLGRAAASLPTVGAPRP